MLLCLGWDCGGINNFDIETGKNSCLHCRNIWIDDVTISATLSNEYKAVDHKGFTTSPICFRSVAQ